jgi:crotonobetainyl-CoA:carnitine CoA-transferase CaiB-like acyl-CoA transferase
MRQSFALSESLVSDYELAGRTRSRAGGSLPGVAPSNAYPTADGRMVMIAANADAIWERLVVAMGRPDLETNDWFATHRRAEPTRTRSTRMWLPGHVRSTSTRSETF